MVLPPDTKWAKTDATWPKVHPLKIPEDPASEVLAMGYPETVQSADPALFQTVVAGNGTAAWEPGDASRENRDDIMIVDVDDLLLGANVQPPPVPQELPATLDATLDEDPPAQQELSTSSKSGKMQNRSEEVSERVLSEDEALGEGEASKPKKVITLRPRDESIRGQM